MMSTLIREDGIARPRSGTPRGSSGAAPRHRAAVSTRSTAPQVAAITARATAINNASEANAQVGALQTVTGDGAVGWRFRALTGLAPPTGASRARVGFRRNAGTTGNVWITPLAPDPPGAFDFAAAAEILTVEHTQADAGSPTRLRPIAHFCTGSMP